MQRRSSIPEYRARLRHGADVLAGCNHPAVEALVALEHGDGTTTLVTSFLGGRSWASAAITDPEALARLAARLLMTLGDLHASGVTHGGLSRSRIRLSGDDGRPLLCGFTDGHRRVDGDPRIWEARRSADVRAVGRLLVDTLTEGTGTTTPPRAGRGRARRFSRRPRLLRLADRIAEGEIPTAEDAAARLGRGGSPAALRVR